jgi:hypothetical protein
MTARPRCKHDATVLATKPYRLMSRGERSAATKRGIVAPAADYREKQLRRRYGMTHADYAALMTAQDSRCAVCRETRELHIDHDHATGLVRGLLCPRCNSLVGHVESQQALLPAAVAYLKERSAFVLEESWLHSLEAA